MLPRRIAHVWANQTRNAAQHAGDAISDLTGNAAQPASDAISYQSHDVRYDRQDVRVARAPCRVEVSMRVARRNWRRFEALGKEFVPIFGQAGLTIAYAFNDDNGENDPITAFNYWDIGNELSRYLHAQLTLPDNPRFGLLDEVLDVEIKNIVIPIVVPPARLNGDFQYLRVESRLDAARVAEFGARLDTFLAVRNRTNGWGLGSAYFYMTGTDDTLAQVWTVPRGSTRAGVEPLLDALPWNELFEPDTRNHELYRRSAFDR
jgi:hypothetical protein